MEHAAEMNLDSKKKITVLVDIADIVVSVGKYLNNLFIYEQMLYEVSFQTVPTFTPWLELLSTDPHAVRKCLKEAKAEIIWLRILDSSGAIIHMECQKKPWKFQLKQFLFLPNGEKPPAILHDL